MSEDSVSAALNACYLCGSKGSRRLVIKVPFQPPALAEFYWVQDNPICPHCLKRALLFSEMEIEDGT